MVFVESTKVDRRGCVPSATWVCGTTTSYCINDWQTLFVRMTRCRLSSWGIGRKARRFRPWEGGAPLTRAAAATEVDDWDDWELVAPSAIAGPGQDEPTPRALTLAEVQDLISMWADAARRADEAGFDVLEIHGAHGYLLHQFLSPIANARNDQYGGSERNRMRMVIEVAEAIRAVWPASKPLFIRLSVEDDGFGPDESVNLARELKPLGVDVIDCSSGGMMGRPVDSTGRSITATRPAERLRSDVDIATMAVGLIVHADQAESILQAGQADLIALARELLYNPNWPMDAAQKLGVDVDFASVPDAQAYWLAKRASGLPHVTPSTFGADQTRAHAE